MYESVQLFLMLLMLVITVIRFVAGERTADLVSLAMISSAFALHLMGEREE